MNLIKSNQLTMSSREISDVVESRHDNVKRTIETLTKKRLISFTQTEEKTGGRKASVYHVNKRDSYVVVAQLCPEFAARLVDRWQELENQQAPSLPQSFAEALQLAADQAKQIEQQEQALALAAPKVEFVDRYADSDGLKGFREVCKLLGVKETAFRRFLESEKIMYRLAGKLTAYAEHIQAGRFSTKTGEKDGHAFSQCKFTPKGVTWISEQWSKKESYYGGE